MRQTVKVLLALGFAAGTFAASTAQAQEMQYFRSNDKSGFGQFETTKKDQTPFKGMTVKIGGSFTQDYQMLSSENYVTSLSGAFPKADSANILADLTNGFNLAMANLTLDAQLDDGVRANVTLYLSSRHHSETWVKSGYFQMDKMPFFKSDMIDKLMEDVTIKVGHLEVDFGDAHFRRTDGGHSIHNPFVENYIIDAFATEIGTEIYYHPAESGIIALVGITNGMLNPTVVEPTAIDAKTNEVNTYNPAFHAKLGYDKQLNEDIRVRLTGSLYNVSSTSRNTLFAGDRTGSHYFLVMEKKGAAAGDAFTSGRFSPNFTDEVMAIAINPFVKFGGLEVFGNVELLSGRTITEADMRNATQIAADVMYRFGPTDNFWVAGRYNTVKSEMPATSSKTNTVNEIGIDRIAGSLGWFITPNVLMKLEYVQQEYKDFDNADFKVPSILGQGKFNGLVVSAALGF